MCGKDGSIVFTSMRDGDIELYRMDADGKNVRRLTQRRRLRRRRVLQRRLPKIVWRASRPKPGKELDDYKRLLAQNLVRPTQARALRRRRRRQRRAPGDVPRRGVVRAVLPPGGKRIIFSSNYGDPRGREFDIWAIDVDGTASSGSRTRPGSTASRCSRPTASGSRSRRTARPRRARTTPTSSSPTGSSRCAGVATRAAEHAPADRIAARRRAGWPIRRAQGRGIGTRGPRGGGRVHRAALQGARARAGRRRRRLPAGVRGARRA